MKEVGRYDAELQQFVEPLREANLNTLRSLRWAVENGKAGHGPAGPSSGEYEVANQAALAEVRAELAAMASTNPVAPTEQAPGPKPA